MIKKSSLLMLIGNLFFTGLFAPKTPTPPTKDEMRAARVAFFSPAGGAADSVALGAAPALPVAATQTISESGFFLDASFSLDRKTLLAFRTSPSLQAVIRYHDAEQTRLVNFDANLNVTSEIVLSAEFFKDDSRARYLPDGQSFLALNVYESIKIVDATTGNLKVVVNSPDGTDRGGNIPRISFSADGQKILLLCHRIERNAGLAVVNADTGQQITAINDSNVQQTSFHPSGLFLAGNSWVRDVSSELDAYGRSRFLPAIKVFDTNTGAVVHCSPPLSSYPRAVKHCCNGNAIAIMLEDGIYKWVPGTAEVVRLFEIKNVASVASVDFCPGGAICAIGRFGRSKFVIDLNTGRLIKEIYAPGLTFSLDSKLALWQNERSIFLADGKTFELIQVVQKDLIEPSPYDGIQFLDSSDGFILKRYEGLELYRFKTFMEINIAQDAIVEHVARVKAFSSAVKQARTALETECHTEQRSLIFQKEELVSRQKIYAEERQEHANHKLEFLKLQQQHFIDRALIQGVAERRLQLQQDGDCCAICKLGACRLGCSGFESFDINELEKFCETCQVNTRLRPESPGAFVTSCGHLFHKDCIKTWFLTPGVSDLGANGIRRYRCPACQKHVAVPADFFDAAPAPASGAAGSN